MAASIEELPKYFRAHSKIEEAQYHKAKVHSVGWNCDGRKLASGSTDRTVCTYTIDRDRLVCIVCHFGLWPFFRWERRRIETTTILSISRLYFTTMVYEKNYYHDYYGGFFLLTTSQQRIIVLASHQWTSLITPCLHLLGSLLFIDL